MNLDLDSFPTQSPFTNSKLNYPYNLVSATLEEYLNTFHIVSNVSLAHASAILGNSMYLCWQIRNTSFV